MLIVLYTIRGRYVYVLLVISAALISCVWVGGWRRGKAVGKSLRVYNVCVCERACRPMCDSVCVCLCACVCVCMCVCERARICD